MRLDVRNGFKVSGTKRVDTKSEIQNEHKKFNVKRESFDVTRFLVRTKEKNKWRTQNLDVESTKSDKAKE